MRLDITKTENGYHVNDTDDGEYCFESLTTLLSFLGTFCPCEVDDVVIFKDGE